MREIDDDTIIAYDQYGQIVKAERLQKWAYNQLAVAPDFLEACKMRIKEWDGDKKYFKPHESESLKLMRQIISKAEK